VKLVDRVEVFADQRPVERAPVNIHAVLEHVKRLAQSGFARHIRFIEELRPVAAADVGQSRSACSGLPQPVKNAAEADRSRKRDRRRDRS
jgi:two-component system, NtrC family, nitrogen regulation sensor histidine kinase GlnL